MLIHLHTYGCQMNRCDSELIRTLLSSDEIQWASTPEKADVILVNTCCVRQHAEKRALGRIRQLASIKHYRPWVRFGVLGCMAQKRGERLFDEIPDLDWVVGPDEYRKLPTLIGDQLLSDSNVSFLRKPRRGALLQESSFNSKKIFLNAGTQETYDDIIPTTVKGPTAFVSVMRGCNNYCSYCIVPYVRGPERSRPMSSIAKEVTALVSQNVREITLLGQNVNSYKDNSYDFADLLKAVSQVPGLLRLKFLTSHPKDLSEKLLQVMSEVPQICPFLHLPVQSGSNRILAMMNRQYTREQYLHKVGLVRKTIPDIALTTDILVGFPGETEEDFQNTIDLMKEVQFQGAFSFRYSVRAGTAAASLPDDVTEAFKIQRLEAVIQLQRDISRTWYESRIGKTIEVLIEGSAKKSKGFLMGRSPQDEVVIFNGNGTNIGEFKSVKINRVKGYTLVGELV
jgi:tRNA-2-methylthio-N6-dimethylallyladenosine synthase